MPEATMGALMGVLRVIFMGTAEVSCAALAKICAEPSLHPVAVVTQPDKPRGRDLKLTPSPVKILAEKLGLPVLQPLKARDADFINQLRELKPDIMVVVAYGQILPPAILELPPFGCLNIHMSLLPKYRGAAPIQWAMANGERETGVTIMKMDAGLDTGPILSVQRTPILPADDSQTLHDRLAQMGASLLMETIPDYVAGKIQPQPQAEGESSYAAKIKKEDGHIDWRRTADQIWNRLRAFTPWPGAFTQLPPSLASKRPLLKIIRAEVADLSGQPGEILAADEHGLVIACREKALRILELQREGDRRLPAKEFLVGLPLSPGVKFA
jgi:methionyl-tRNA formyltransferase